MLEIIAYPVQSLIVYDDDLERLFLVYEPLPEPRLYLLYFMYQGVHFTCIPRFPLCLLYF